MQLTGRIYNVYVMLGSGVWHQVNTCPAREAEDHVSWLFNEGWQIVKLERVQ